MGMADQCMIGRSEGESLLGGFRHAVAVPASCGCNSDACRSVWQSSSCSFVYGCCGETNTVKEGGGGRRSVNISDQVKGTTNPRIPMHTLSSMHTNTQMVECSFRTHSHPFSCWLFFFLSFSAITSNTQHLYGSHGSENGCRYSTQLDFVYVLHK